MRRIIAWWVHNPVAANLLMVGILLSGFLGLQAMEKEAFPQIKINQAAIEIAWPGANPQEVEEQIIGCGASETGCASGREFEDGGE